MSIPQSHYITGEMLFRQLQMQVDITVATLAERDALAVWQRRWKMIVGVYNDENPTNNKHYTLEYNKKNDDIGDNENWDLLIKDANFTMPITHKLEEIIQHNLGIEPSVSIKGEDNFLIIADVEHIDKNNVKVTFSEYFTGILILNY